MAAFVMKMAGRKQETAAVDSVWRYAQMTGLNVFENKNEALATKSVFITRVIFSFLISLVVICVSLGSGAWGYHVFGELGWIDSLLNAAMILTGMGPVDPMKSVNGKLFATFYCLFSGIIFLTLMAIIMAPIYHRFLHSFHLADDDEGGDK